MVLPPLTGLPRGAGQAAVFDRHLACRGTRGQRDHWPTVISKSTTNITGTSARAVIARPGRPKTVVMVARTASRPRMMRWAPCSAEIGAVRCARVDGVSAAVMMAAPSIPVIGKIGRPHQKAQNDASGIYLGYRRSKEPKGSEPEFREALQKIGRASCRER